MPPGLCSAQSAWFSGKFCSVTSALKAGETTLVILVLRAVGNHLVQLYGNAVNGLFRLFQTSLFSNNLFLRKHLYYQFLVYFRIVGNHAQRVKYLHRVDVNIDCRTLNLVTGNLLGLLKGKSVF